VTATRNEAAGVVEGALCHIAWAQGGAANVLSAAADAIRLRSSVPSPPGSRIAGAVQGEEGGSALEVRVKIHVCKRQPDGTFVLEGRPLDLTRDARARLVALALEASPSGGA